MKNTKATEIKVGLVSITAIVLVCISIVLIKGVSMGSSSKLIKIRFPNSGGLTVSSPVVVNGVKRGEVKSVANDNGSVLVTAEIDNIDDFKADVNATILILEITGGKKIEINPGISSDKFNINDEIKGATPPDISDLVAIAGGMVIDAKDLVKKLDTLSARVNGMLDDGKIASQLKSTLNNADAITAMLKVFLEKNSGDLTASIKNMKSISTDLKYAIQKNTPKVEDLISKLDNTLNSTKTIISGAELTLVNANSLIQDLNDVTKNIKSGNGMVNRLIYDKTLSMRLDSTINSLTELVNMIKQHGVNVNLRLGTRP